MGWTGAGIAAGTGAGLPATEQRLRRGRMMLVSALAEDDARRAANLYLSAGDELAAAEALLDLSRYVSHRGDDAEEFELMREARRLVARHPPGRVSALLLHRDAGNAMMAGRAADPLAQGGRVRSRLQQHLVVVRLEQQHGAAAQQMSYAGRGSPQVVGHAGLAARRVGDSDGDRLARVVPREGRGAR